MSNKYPVLKNIYYQKVGKLLPHRIGQILKELGYNEKNHYRIWINPKQGNDVDIKMWHKGSLILVGEILNWSIKSQLSEKRFKSMTNNLSQFSCQKVVIHTLLPEEKVKIFQEKGIKTLEIGFQTLPKHFYNHFAIKGQTFGRKIDNKNTKIDIKIKIINFFKNNLKIIVKINIRTRLREKNRWLKKILRNIFIGGFYRIVRSFKIYTRAKSII